MASLEPPLTVISEPVQRSSSSKTDASSDTTTTTTEGTFQPPAATWYDESHGHFLVLLDREEDKEEEEYGEKKEETTHGCDESVVTIGTISTSLTAASPKKNNIGGWRRWSFSGASAPASATAAAAAAAKKKKHKLTETIYFRTLQVPNSNKQNPSPTTFSPASSMNSHTSETSTTTSKNEEPCRNLPLSPPIPVLLPYKLANMGVKQLKKPPAQAANNKSPAQDSTASGKGEIQIKRRVPILAKISLDGTLIALQYTPTLLRIVRIQNDSSSSSSSGESPIQQKQWTIDVSSTDANPILSNGKTVPLSRRSSLAVSTKDVLEPIYPSAENTTADSSNSTTTPMTPPQLKPLIPSQTAILPGGVLWSDHGGNSQDLIVITTTCIITYKISLSRNNMARVRTYAHYKAAHFWFEPVKRCLMIGSYAKFHHELYAKLKKKKKKNEKNEEEGKKEVVKPSERIMLMKTYFLQVPPPSINRTNTGRSDSGGTMASSLTSITMDLHDGMIPSSSLHSTASVMTTGGASIMNGNAAAGGSNNPGGLLFPRLELPPPDRLPMFVLGECRGDTPPDISLDEEEEQQLEKTLSSSSSQSTANSAYTSTISPDEIALVNLYGKVYCVELGCFGNGIGLRLHPLERKNGGVGGSGGELMDSMTFIPKTFIMKNPNAGSSFISVLDNILGVHCKSDYVSFFIDIKDATASTNANTTTTVEQKEEEYEDASIFFDGTVIVSEKGGKDDHDHDDSLSKESLYNESFFFLPPCFLLNSQGRGHLYQIKLDLPTIVSAIPKSVCPMRFLLRRGISRKTTHSLAIERLHDILNDMDDVSFRSWMSAISGAYSKIREDISMWDDEASIPLVFRAALLPPSTLLHEEPGKTNKVFNPFEHSPICSHPPQSCRYALTQTEVLERALLPQASFALASSDIKRLRFLANVALDFFCELESVGIDPCPALECLVVALLWRLGDALDVLAFLQSRQVKMAMAKKKSRIENSATLGKSSGNAPKKGIAAVDGAAKSASVGSEVFAEMLLMIVTGVELGVGVGKEKSGSDTPPKLSGIPEWESNVNLKQLLITYAVDILCSTSSHQAATRYLLAMGQIMDAIAVCSKLVAQSLYNTRQSEDSPSPSHGTMAEDFFCVAVECAKKMPCVSDRTRLFQYLHSFLKQWDRDCFRVESHKVGHKSTNVMKSWIDSSSSSTGTLKHDSSSNRRRSCPESLLLSSNEDEKEIICSRLAFNHGDFPHDLFGGEGSEECLRLRQMFGYDLYL